MRKKFQAVFFVFILIFVIFLGCTEKIEYKSNQNFDNSQPEDCPGAKEVDKWEENFTKMRAELVDYMLNTEYEYSDKYPLNPSGNITDLGRKKRLEYESFRKDYMDMAYKLCKNSSGTTLHGGSIIWLKGYDLIKKEIHPETFLNLSIFNKRKILYEEPDFYTNETTDFVEYSYSGIEKGYRVQAYIRAWHTGSVKDVWYDKIQEYNLKKVTYKSPQSPGSSVYYTNDYVDEYGWRWKGIYFVIYGFKVFAGYYSWGNSTGTEYGYFKDINITEEYAKDMYEYLVYRPGYNDMY